MLNVFPVPHDGKFHPSGVPAPDALWIDLLNPTSAEIENVEKMHGATLPSLETLSEIETSSRLRNQDGVLYMSTPSAAKHAPRAVTNPPIGFILSSNRLITVRFMPLPAFETVAAKFAGQDAPASSLEVFILLFDEIVDRVADGLEHLATELNCLSVDAFHADDARGRHAARANRLLRIQLRQVGRLGNRFSEVRDGLQGLGRIIAYTEQHTNDWFGDPFSPRLESLARDIHSLLDYEEQLANKVQFVLDALVGLIGIAQNDIFKVLTIVSIVGIPPTLIAGVYGMNFKNMPEYGWAWGYQYGWAVILLSAVIPLIWFKVKGWF
ncbi:MAG: magnesium transporter CorA family protein [Sphingobium sp.]|nr:magnesium transporter CorA family protein [Sphingobium sp.]